MEYHIKNALEGVRQVNFDVFRSDTGSNLVAYFSYDDVTGRQSESSPFEKLTPPLQSAVTALVGTLAVSLPSYMVPVMFIPCSFMLVTASDKIDRKLLEILTEGLSKEERAAYALAEADKRLPETEIETRMQKQWSEALNISPESISRDDSFLRIGGDSIAAI